MTVARLRKSSASLCEEKDTQRPLVFRKKENNECLTMRRVEAAHEEAFLRLSHRQFSASLSASVKAFLQVVCRFGRGALLRRGHAGAGFSPLVFVSLLALPLRFFCVAKEGLLQQHEAVSHQLVHRQKETQREERTADR